MSCSPQGVARSAPQLACSGENVETLFVIKPEILSNICELLCFCVHHHPYRMRTNFVFNNVIEKVMFLTRRRERYLVVAAVRFMRTIVSRNDEQLLLYIVKNNLLKPLVDAFVGNGNRYNLLNSSVLELFEHIRKENLKSLIMYLIDSFWNQLSKFDYLPSIQALKLKYEQCLENCDMRRTVDLVDSRKRMDERALEKEEEDYFNEDSDEEDSASAQSSRAQNQEARSAIPNGVSFSCPSLRPRSIGLVDYDDDEDDEDYIPPSKRKSETPEDGKTPDLSPKPKRKYRNEELDLKKKQRLHRPQGDENAVLASACSTCTTAASDNEKENSNTHGSPHSSDEDNNSNEGNHNEKKAVVSRSCSDCLAKTPDHRQPSGDDCPSISPTPGNNSSLDMALNGGNVPGSEPYSVR